MSTVKIQSDRLEKTRRLIINTASKVFLKRGIRNISIDELCKVLPVSKGTFYKYFPNKESLVETVFDECIAEALPAIEENFSSGMEIEQIVETHYNLVIDLIVSKVSVQMMVDMEILMPHIYARIEELRKREILEMIKLIKRGQNEGLMRKDLDPEVVTALFGELINSINKPGFLMSKNLTPKQVISTIKTMFLHGLLEQNEK